MATKTLAQKAEEIVEEAFRRLQKLEDSLHDWTELKDVFVARNEMDIYFAFEDWQDKRLEELLKEDYE